MAHSAVEGLEVAAAVAELADAAMGALQRRKDHVAADQERQHELELAEEALAKERAEKEKLQLTLKMYRDALNNFEAQGLLPHLEQLDGMGPDQLCDKLKERVDSPQFLDKLGANSSSPESWVVLEEDFCEDYVVISQDDIVDSIACFMAKYLATQPKAKDMTPEEIQKALSRAFSTKESTGFFQRIWRTGKVVYTVASWTTAAIGLYRNPLLLRAASMALWTTITVLVRLVK